MSTMKIKKGDTVKVIAGKDKDKEGKVLSVDKKNGRVVVEGVKFEDGKKVRYAKATGEVISEKSAK